MNLGEENTIKEYTALGYSVLRLQTPDFLFYKDNEGVVSDVIFVEVKQPKGKLSPNQAKFKKVLDSLGISFKIEYKSNKYSNDFHLFETSVLDVVERIKNLYGKILYSDEMKEISSSDELTLTIAICIEEKLLQLFLFLVPEAFKFSKTNPSSVKILLRNFCNNVYFTDMLFSELHKLKTIQDYNKVVNLRFKETLDNLAAKQMF